MVERRGYFLVLLHYLKLKDMTKALFFDIDGTLVSFGTHSIPESTVEALKKAHQNGHKIFIATGRPKAIINNLSQIQSLGIIDGYITMNGAYCFVNDHVVYKSAIPHNEVMAIGRFCEKHHHACIFVAEHTVAVCQPNHLLQEIFYDYLHVDPIPVKSLEDATQTEIFQITPFITTEQEAEIHHEIPNCEIGRWYPAFSDITAIGNTKQKGIDEMINYFGIKLEDTMAFGDGGNDISMLRHAAISVAMGNAKDDVKAAANYITSSVDDDGIKNALEHFGII